MTSVHAAEEAFVMLTYRAIAHRIIFVILSVMLVGVVAGRRQAVQAREAATAAWKAEFLTLCDLAVAELRKQPAVWKEAYRTTVDSNTHHVPFFEDSYGVRALLVAYDMTGNKKYLDACTRWTDRIVALQQGMIPKGAYYVNYGNGRAVGQDKGDWYVADSSSVAMAVLATAVRTRDKQRRDRYLNSVRSFARLVIDNYVGKDGGITDGIWSGFAGEWWSSTSIFSAVLYLAYGETHDPEYLKTALGATDWLNRHDFNNPQPPAFEALGPGVVFYCFESYATALPYLEPGSPRRKAAEDHIAEALGWMAKNQQGRGAKNKLDYLDSDTYMGGNPFIMCAMARQLPQCRDQAAEAERELRYVYGLLFKDGKPAVTRIQVWELVTWAMMSYAEKLSPGTLFRSSRDAARPQ
jgi:hypothetical protein